MRRMTSDQIAEELEQHRLWLRMEGGRQADFSNARLDGARLDGARLDGARLDGASLVGASLVGASLDRASLVGASLVGARGIRHASVGWSEHGECGRTLLGVVIGDDIQLFCGCFSGSVADLERYINDGDAALRESRTLAMRIVVGLLLWGEQ